MKHFGIALGLAALLAAFSLSSCITTDPNLGSGLVPADQDITLKTATFDLPVSLRMIDSIQTATAQSITVGAIRTRRFGLYRSDGAMSVVPAYDSIVWGKNPSVRSLNLTLVLDTTFVARESERYIPQNLYVHQLNVELDTTMVYNNSLTEADYNPENLSEGGIIYTGEQLYSVRLKKELGRRLFEIPMSTLDSAELFMKDFHGLYLRCDDPEENTEGGRLNAFDLSSSYITLNYDYDDEDGNRKTNSAIFLLGTYYTVNICSSGSEALAQEDPANALYMESICGIKPHIDARQVREILTNWAEEQQIPTEGLIIAKATLSFPFEYDGDRSQFDHFSNNLFPCQRIRGTRLVNYVPLTEINNTEVETGTIDRSLLTYTANVSSYLQGLIQREESSLTDEDDLWIMPTISYYNSTTGVTYYYADSFFYTQNTLNGTAAARHPQIKLTYTVLK